MSISLLIAGLVVVVVVCLGMVVHVSQSPAPFSKAESSLSYEAFLRSYKNHTQAILIDIRTPDEFRNGHLEGAVNIDYYRADFIEAMKAIAVNKTLFIYCRSGNRSAHAMHVLRQAGIAVVTLDNGIDGHTGSLVQ